MFYETTLKLFKDFGFIMRNYDDVLAASDLRSYGIRPEGVVDQCAMACRRDYLLLLSKVRETLTASRAKMNWSGLCLLKNDSRESVFEVRTPVEVSLSMDDDANDPYFEDEESRWRFNVNGVLVGDEDSFTRFNSHILAFLFKRRQQELKSTILLECVPEAEQTSPDSPYVCTLTERLLNWFKVLP